MADKRITKIGMKVKMVNCVEAETYGDTIWETRSEPWMCCGTEVVLLKGRSGGFATDCLEDVEEANNG